ncbi:MAG: hypothetical protein ACXIU7_00570 [Roseinatronobacter sp.]
MEKAYRQLVERIQNNPHKIAGFAAGLFVPLLLLALSWAQNSGGLAGPLVDPRPPAFVVPVD